MTTAKQFLAIALALVLAGAYFVIKAQLPPAWQTAVSTVFVFGFLGWMLIRLIRGRKKS